MASNNDLFALDPERHSRTRLASLLKELRDSGIDPHVVAAAFADAAILVMEEDSQAAPMHLMNLGGAACAAAFNLHTLGHSDRRPNGVSSHYQGDHAGERFNADPTITLNPDQYCRTRLGFLCRGLRASGINFQVVVGVLTDAAIFVAHELDLREALSYLTNLAATACAAASSLESLRQLDSLPEGWDR